MIQHRLPNAVFGSSHIWFWIHFGGCAFRNFSHRTHIQLHNSAWGFQSWFKGAEPSGTPQSSSDTSTPPQAMFPGDLIKTAPLPRILGLLDATWVFVTVCWHRLFTCLSPLPQIGISLGLLNLSLTPFLYQVQSCSPFNKQDLRSFSLVPSNENTTIIAIL